MVLHSIDWSRIELEMSEPRGWLQLAVVAIAIAIAWLVDRRVMSSHRAPRHPDSRISGSLVRVIFPLTAWLLLWLARIAMRRSGSTFFLDIAMPLMMALVAIRIVVYGLRRMFSGAAWLKTSERTIAFAIWAVVVLGFIGFLPEMLDNLASLTIPLGKGGVPLLNFLEGALVVAGTLIATLWISSFLEQRLMRASFDLNLRVVLAKLLRAMLLTVATLIALQWIGFDLTLLSVFGGALGVGIGLGLQKLAANYVSGFAILFDRSIRMSDRITVADRTGIVTRLTARYVVVRDLDGTESIVPNEMMVTSIVLRHPPVGEVRIPLPVQVAPDADVERALALMEEAARTDSRVRTGANPPRALLRGFGETGVRLELGIWVQNAEVVRTDGDNIRSAVNRAVLAAFREHGIPLAPPATPWLAGTGGAGAGASGPGATGATA
ncbi:MAG TPA: mechanosensitive ion channel domain-containing protein [Casimicrobiaceae bacterium]